MTPDVERILRASAKAHRATGVPISTHTAAAHKVGLLQQDVFESEGVDLGRVVIGHSGDSDDVEYLTTLMKRGSISSESPGPRTMKPSRDSYGARTPIRAWATSTVSITRIGNRPEAI